MKSRKVIYSRGFPYGAPYVALRGGGIKNCSGALGYLHERGFQWQMSGRQSYAWETYMERQDLGVVLKNLRDLYGCEIVPKDGMDPSYLIDLDDAKFGRPNFTEKDVSDAQA